MKDKQGRGIITKGNGKYCSDSFTLPEGACPYLDESNVSFYGFECERYNKKLQMQDDDMKSHAIRCEECVYDGGKICKSVEEPLTNKDGSCALFKPKADSREERIREVLHNYRKEVNSGTSKTDSEYIAEILSIMGV